MATYISLLRFTQQGIEGIKESPMRLDAAKSLFQSMGAELKAFYSVMGQYDAVVISEGPDDDTVAKLSFLIAGQGAVRTETLRAFNEDEYREILSSLP
jgi:uncharacterized protein with GYD domain